MGSTPVGIYSASGVSAILNLNPYKTAVHVWQEICEKLEPGFNESRGYKLPVFEESAALRWGLAFENAVIKLAEEKEGVSILGKEKLFEIKKGGIKLSCHIDGHFEEGYFGSPLIYEGKTTNTRAFYQIKEEKKRWGDPGTDEVPEEYQVQAAVQRICTGAELVKLSVLVFPKTTDDFEALGWRIEEESGKPIICNDNTEFSPIYWANMFAQIGNFHTYLLPTNKKLESLIIQKIQEFDQNHVKTRIPPTPTKYEDVRRLLTNPVGTILATPSLKKRCIEYSEITRQTGASGPLAKRKDELKTEIMTEVMTSKKDDWSDPPNKVIVIDPDGGNELASFAKNKNGNLTFRAKKAK